jgi:hypothetical protein
MARPATFSAEGLSWCRRLVHREFGTRTGRHLTLDAGQRGADQAPMDGSFRNRPARGGLGVRFQRVTRLNGSGLLVDQRGCRRGWLGFSVRERNLRGVLALPPWRDPGLLVFVLGVAGGASHESNAVVHHRYDRVIADAALARTVVVDDLTNPGLALLHETNL